MKNILKKFDKKISVKDFDRKILKLVSKIPKEISVLIKVLIKNDHIEVRIKNNPNKNTNLMWEWDLNIDSFDELKDNFYSIN